jgi:hypothetical protein
MYDGGSAFCAIHGVAGDVENMRRRGKKTMAKTREIRAAFVDSVMTSRLTRAAT